MLQQFFEIYRTKIRAFSQNLIKSVFDLFCTSQMNAFGSACNVYAFNLKGKLESSIQRNSDSRQLFTFHKPLTVGREFDKDIIIQVI